jgi:hypothetical protein
LHTFRSRHVLRSRGVGVVKRAKVAAVTQAYQRRPRRWRNGRLRWPDPGKANKSGVPQPEAEPERARSHARGRLRRLSLLVSINNRASGQGLAGKHGGDETEAVCTQPRSLYSTRCPAELTNRALLAAVRTSRARRSGRGLEGGWPCRLRAASAASHHQRPGRPWALRCNLGLPTDNTHIEALLTFMKPPPPHHLDLPILTRFRTIRSLKRCLTMAQYHVRQHHYSSRI